MIGILSAVVRAYIAQVRLSGLTPMGDGQGSAAEYRRPSGDFESSVVTPGERGTLLFRYAVSTVLAGLRARRRQSTRTA